MTEPAPALNPTHVRYLYGALKAMMAVLSELPTTDYMDGRRDQCKHMLDMLDELTDEARTDAEIEAQAYGAAQIAADGSGFGVGRRHPVVTEQCGHVAAGHVDVPAAR